MTRVLIHVEDPGALNLLRELPAQLASRGVAVDVVADGHAGIALAASPFVRADDTADLLRRSSFLVTGTSENQRSRSLALIAGARATGIPSAAVVDLPVNAALRFAGGTDDPLAFIPSLVWCVDDPAVAAFRALGVPPDRVGRIANPRLAALRARGALDAAQRRTLRATRFPAYTSGTLVVFAAEPASSIDPRLSHDDGTYTLHGTSGSTWRTHIALEETIAALRRLPERSFLAVRLHPKNTPADVAPYGDAIAAIDAGGDPVDAVLAADIVIGLSSMVLQEAATLGVRTLAVLPRALERAWLPMLDDGTIPSVTTRDEIQRVLPGLIAGPPPAPRADAALPLLDALLQRLR